MATREIRSKLLNAPTARSDGFGIDHNIVITWINAEDAEIEAAHLPCPIPLADFATLLSQMTNAQRSALYKSLIRANYGATAHSPEIPQHPANLDDLSEWDTYADAKEDYDTQLAQNVSDATSYAEAANNWIQSLPSFDVYPFDFVLQEAS